MTNITINSGCTKLTFPTKPVVKKFKVAKARSYMTFRGSKDPAGQKHTAGCEVMKKVDI